MEYTKENIIGIKFMYRDEDYGYEVIPPISEGEDFSLKTLKTGKVHSNSAWIMSHFIKMVKQETWRIIYTPEPTINHSYNIY